MSTNLSFVVIRSTLILVLAVSSLGCANRNNVLARFGSVKVPARDRVALAVHLKDGPFRVAFETPEAIKFTLISSRGEQRRARERWAMNGQMMANGTDTYVFEFTNSANRPATIYFPKDGANHGRLER